ncbi:Uncharacterized protein OBRU01_01821 [Operophtera brumata]|uniref:MADF domain-containing protein n=1 Tax=Operophtera brumata TaxID=104452 RepID=A0A0L7LRU9_OPEBR|nr:Uncharacterized protein OBRU01_01821 [Operophtera brumata]
MEWSNELTLEFLRLYEREEAIWKSTTPQHKNKNEVHEAWLRIRNQIKDGAISITDLKKKKENLMSTYRKVNAKVKDSTRKGRGADGIYRPEWPFYSTMAKFLDDVYKPRNTKTTVVVSDDSEEESDEESNEESNEASNEASIQPTQYAESSEEETDFKPPKTIPKKKMKIDETQDRMDEASNYLKQLNQKPQKDVSAMYSDLLAEKLRNLKEHTREIAMLEIDKLLYNLKQQEKIQQPTPHDEAQMTQVLHQPPPPWQQFYQSQPPSGYHPYFQLQPLSTPTSNSSKPTSYASIAQCPAIAGFAKSIIFITLDVKHFARSIKNGIL